MKPTVAIVIPAYNEANRIRKVLEAAVGSELADEVIVVSDGSRDATAEVAQSVPGVRTIALTTNLGKGGAMAMGVANTHADIIAFVDADLDGLNSDHIDLIIQPLLDGRCDMCVGVFRGGKVWSDTAQRVTPFLSGQRALRRWVFEAVPNVAELRLGVEVALNSTAKKRRARIKRVILRGVSNTHKEQKLGLLKGTAARARMYAEIGQAMVKNNPRFGRERPKRKKAPWA